MMAILEWLSQTNLLRHNQRVELEEDRKHLEEQLQQAMVQHPGQTRRELKRLQKQLETQSPRPMSPNERDVLAKKKNELLSEITSGMLTQEEMRKNPTGAAHRHLEWEKANKQKILLLKNLMIQLEPDNEDPDLANLERFRPEQRTAGPGVSTFMVNAQIPGSFAMTPLAKANWPEELEPHGTVNSPLAQARKREKTAEERAVFGQRMKEARARKKQGTAKEV